VTVAPTVFPPPERDERPRLSLLIAYPYMSPKVAAAVAARADDIRLLVDSGAFTAWKAGKSIAVADYIAFLRDLPVEPWRYFNLDVVGDPVGSMANYRTMLDAGMRPVPIFTRGAPIAQLDEYYRTSDVVGIGGLVGTPGNKGFINGIMRAAAGRRVHWLGFTQRDFLRYWRPYMCDSSTWSMGSRRRFIPLYIGNGFVRQFKKHEFTTQALPTAAADALIRYGIDPASCALAPAWENGSRLLTDVGMHSFVEMSLDAHRTVGSHVFIAVNHDREVELAHAAYLRVRSRYAPRYPTPAQGIPA
jgi:hypothetical protein